MIWLSGSPWQPSHPLLGIITSIREIASHDQISEGWWIVEIEWYKYEEGTSPRKYKLLTQSKRWLAVNAIVRAGGLEWESGQRVPRSGIGVLKEASRELIEDCM